jgi:hypothetical protein
MASLTAAAAREGEVIDRDLVSYEFDDLAFLGGTHDRQLASSSGVLFLNPSHRKYYGFFPLLLRL